MYLGIFHSLLFISITFSHYIVSIYLADFYSRNSNLTPLIIGLIIFLVRILDAFLDPLIGRFSDKNFRYIKTIIFLGLFFFIFGFYLLFKIPHSYLITYISIALFIFTLGHSILAINSQGLCTKWDIDLAKIKNTISIRESFAIIGIFIGILTPQLLNQVFSISEPLVFISDYFFVPSLFCALFFFVWISKAYFKKEGAVEFNFKLIFDDKRIKTFFLCYFFSSIALSIPAFTIIYFVRDYLNLYNFLWLFLLLYFSSGIIGIAFWNKFSRNYDPYQIWLLNLFLSSLIFIFVIFLKPNDYFFYALFCLFTGFFGGANIVIPPIIIANKIKDTNREIYSSSYYAIVSFLSKTGLAFGILTAFFFLEMINYTPSNYSTHIYIPYIYAGLPSLILMSVTIWLYMNTFKKNYGN